MDLQWLCRQLTQQLPVSKGIRITSHIVTLDVLHYEYVCLLNPLEIDNCCYNIYTVIISWSSTNHYQYRGNIYSLSSDYSEVQRVKVQLSNHITMHLVPKKHYFTIFLNNCFLIADLTCINYEQINSLHSSDAIYLW